MSDSPILPTHPVLLHGGDWNPDQWLDRPEIIARDLDLMQKAGCTTFSLGIFAWSALETADGVFTMDWMADILDRMAERGLKAILATPSGAKPLWLAHRHPEIRRVRADGTRELPVGRHNHCPTSPVFRQAVARIDGEIARRFARHPAVAGWHIGNEFNGQCFCPLCLDAFRDHLRRRFATIDALNRAVWADFWAHRFTDWNDVVVQDNVLDGITLEWRRFASARLVDFVAFEIGVLRQQGATQPATTNLMCFFPGLDQRDLARHVDFIANDAYPEFHGGEDQLTTAVRSSLTHDLMRSLKMRTFLQMECSPSATNWQRLGRLKRPGMHRLEMVQALAHGADGTMYFQWRAGRGAFEKWHGAVVDHSDSEQTRVFQDVAAHGVLLQKVAALRGAQTRSQVAVLHDWDTRWAIECSCGPGNESPDRGYDRVMTDCVRPLWERGIGVDVRSRADDLSAYALVIVPMTYLFTQTDADRLRAFVAGGGTVLMTWLSARVNDTNLCHMGGFPGPNLRDVFGIWAEETDRTAAGDAITATGPATWPVRGYIDRLRTEGAEAVFTLAGDPLHAGNPALSRHRFGKGNAWYLAAQPADATGYEAVLAQVVAGLRLDARIAAPQRGFTVQARRDGTTEWLFALNFHDQATATWAAPAGCADAENGQTINAPITLPPMTCRILQRKI